MDNNEMITLAILEQAVRSGKSAGERHAAAELGRYFTRATGRRLQTMAAVPADNLPPFAIWLRPGRTGQSGPAAPCRNAQPALAAGKTTAAFKTDDDFAIENLKAAGILLRGASVRALHYAVYELLGRLGFAWPSCGAEWEIAPAGRVTRIPDPTTRQTPRFRYRGIDPVDRIAEYKPAAMIAHLDWMARNRMNRLYFMLRTDQAYVTRYLLPFTAREAARRGIEVIVPINARDVVPHELLRQRPDYFAFVKAKPVNPEMKPVAVKGGYRIATQLCLSNPALRRFYAGRLLKLVAAFPPHNVNFCIIGNDGAGFCTCARCRRLKPADQVQAIWNTALQALRQRRPDIKLVRYAYTCWQEPPALVPLQADRIDHLMYDIFCRDDERPMDSPDAINAHDWQPGQRRYPTVHAWLMGVMREWVRLNVPVVPWHNSMKMYRRGTAAGLVRVFAHDFDLYEKAGAAGSIFEAYIQYWHGFAQNFYAAARLLWDGRGTAAGCLDEFCRLAFGPAAPPMIRYLNLLERVTQARGKVKPALVFNRLTDRDVARCESDFRAARARTRVPSIRRRIRDLEKHFQYLQACRAETFHADQASRYLRTGRLAEAAREFEAAAGAVVRVARAAEIIERRFGLYGTFWADTQRRKIADYHRRMKPIIQAQAWGRPVLGPGRHALNLALFDTPHYGAFGAFMSQGVRVVSRRSGQGRDELGFCFRLADPARGCRLRLHGGNVVPHWDQVRGIKPVLRITINGRGLYRGQSRVPTIALDPISRAPQAGSGNGAWVLPVPPRLLKKQNVVVINLLGLNAGQSTHFERVAVEV